MESFQCHLSTRFSNTLCTYSPNSCTYKMTKWKKNNEYYFCILRMKQNRGILNGKLTLQALYKVLVECWIQSRQQTNEKRCFLVHKEKNLHTRFTFCSHELLTTTDKEFLHLCRCDSLHLQKSCKRYVYDWSIQRSINMQYVQCSFHFCLSIYNTS